MESLQLFFLRRLELLIIIALLVQTLIILPQPLVITRLVVKPQAILVVLVQHSFL